jgi:hypothetical protein
VYERIELPDEWAGGSLTIQRRVTRLYPGTRTPRQITVVITVDEGYEDD